MLSKRIINRELGVNPFNRRKTNWILAAASAAAGVASSIFGGIQANKARKQAKREQQRRERAEQAWYDRRYNQDYLDTAAGQNLMRQANEYADKQWRKAEGAKAVGGGTDAATAQAKESANRMVGNTVANIAAADTQRKDNVDSQHQSNLQNFSNQTQARYEQQAQDITNASQNASNAMMSMGAALEGAGTKKASSQINPAGNEPSKVTTPVDNNGVSRTPETTDLTGKSALGVDYTDPETQKKLMGRSSFWSDLQNYH